MLSQLSGHHGEGRLPKWLLLLGFVLAFDDYLERLGDGNFRRQTVPCLR